MKRGWLMIAVASQSLVLAGCVASVMVPTVVAKPGLGKSPVDFSADNTACSAQANQQVAGARNAANSQIVGTMLLTDPTTTSATAQSNITSVQQQFDTAYSACMYAKGESVPGYAVEMQPIPNPRRAAPKPKPKSATTPAAASSSDTFVEPAPAAKAPAPASNSGFDVPPPSQH